MIQSRRLFTVAFAALAILSAGQVALSGERAHRVECRKTSDKGCTAHSERCFPAPANEIYTNAQLLGGTGWKQEKVRCQMRLAQPRSVPALVQLPGGKQVRSSLEGHRQLCITSHGESGSGFADMGRVSYATCSVSFDTIPFR